MLRSVLHVLPVIHAALVLILPRNSKDSRFLKFIHPLRIFMAQKYEPYLDDTVKLIPN